jgi:hypothetical protein
VRCIISFQECSVQNQIFLDLVSNQHVINSDLCSVQNVKVVEMCCYV